MTKVIVNADDFGYSNGVNYGIIDCYKKGILTSTTMMPNMPGVEHAVELAKENKGLGVGVHLTLTCGQPVRKDLSTIVDEKGNFKKLGSYKGEYSIDLDELYKEWDAQIEKFISMGLTPTHLDSHHHTHTIYENYKVIIELGKKYSLPIRNNLEAINNEKSIKTTEGFIRDFDFVGLAMKEGKSEKDIEDFLEEKYNEMLKYSTVELMCHPAYMDKEILEGSTWNIQRTYELDALINSKFAKRIKECSDIALVSYKDI